MKPVVVTFKEANKFDEEARAEREMWKKYVKERAVLLESQQSGASTSAPVEVEKTETSG